MNSIRVFSQRIVYTVAIMALLLALVVPLVASAANVTGRSIALSNSSKAATNVTYDVTFTPAGDAGAFVIDFCSNTPLMGESCTAPTGFDASGAATSTAGFSVDSATTTRVVVEGELTEDSEETVTLTGIDNPTAAGALYARIATFEDAEDAAASTPQNLAGSIDQGAVAISITDSIGVSGVVLETLTFCVSNTALTDNCQTIQAPEVVLGEEVGDIVALTPGEVSEDSIYTLISTNAANGAVVRLKSSAAGCGGLMRAGAPEACDIGPALTSDITAGSNTAKFGVKTTTAQGLSGEGFNPNGTLQPVGNYNSTTYALNFAENELTGVTSTFGDPFLDTDGAPVNLMGMEIKFAAVVTNDTPAGSYSTDISLIAVGKF